MKFYGDVDLMQNNLTNAALENLDTFPTNPKVGEICMKGHIVWYVAKYEGVTPLWMPLTNEILTKVHVQDTAASTWTFDHNLGKEVMVQITDLSGNVFFPDEIENPSINTVEVKFNSAQTGKIIVIAADNGESLHTVTALVHTQDEAVARWTIQHNLGYDPFVQVVLSDGFQMIPAAISHSIDSQTTYIDFSSPSSGVARLI